MKDLKKFLISFVILILVSVSVYFVLKQKKEINPVQQESTQLNQNITEKEPITIQNIKTDPYVKYTAEDWYNIDLFKERLYEYFPKEMADFLYSYQVCTFLGGEVGSGNAEQDEMVSKNMINYCIDFETAEKIIEKKYSNSPKLQDMLKLKSEIDDGKSNDNYSFLWDDLKKDSKVLNKYIETEAQYILETVKAEMQEYDVLASKDPESKNLDNIKFRLSVQKGYLNFVLSQIDRLHPITRKEIETLKDNKLFLERASD